MKPRQLRHLLIWFLVIQNIYCCDKELFASAKDTYGTGAVIQTSGSNQFTLHQCLRMCRMFSECWGVNMDISSGYCEAIEIARSMVGKEGWTFYKPCPDGMLPSALVPGFCYAPVHKRITWDAAVSYCTRLHPEAHLMEITSEEAKQQFLEFTVDEDQWWLGARRIPGGGLEDITWHHSNTSMFPKPSYISWAGIEPNGNGACIAMWHRNTNHFYDTPCSTNTIHFICEI